MKTNSFSNQLRWVVLLLAAAVILPTVCLLWFMNQTIKNGQMAIRTKLVDVYEKQYEISREKHLDENWIRVNFSLQTAEGVLIYNEDGVMTFPVPDDEPSLLTDESLFSKAFKLEYIDNDPNQALAEYQRVTRLAQEPALKLKGHISQARCLEKLNRVDEAISILKKAVSKSPSDTISARVQNCNGYLFLLDLIQNSNNKEDYKNLLSQTYEILTVGMNTSQDLHHFGKTDYLKTAIPSSFQVYALNQFIKHAEGASSSPELDKKIKTAKYFSNLFKLSLEVAAFYQQPIFADGPTGSVFRLDTNEQLYGAFIRDREYIRLRIYDCESIKCLFKPMLEDIATFPARCMILDSANQFVAGRVVSKEYQPFIKMPVSDWLPGWEARLYIDDNTFDEAASRQAAIYIWAGVLVIILLIASGILTIHSVNRQIKMNRLKNDFIATVTHELKTPLSSMRLLVDTLLEGRYKDEQTVTEYLQLVSNENKRLTHLIDSFLTFSRMERNKQVFDIKPVSPDSIASAAIEAMRAKLSGDDCCFGHNIAENLPQINADVDGMVTVLVNLLDNAWKYTNGEKLIKLDVYAENGKVCFAVNDNGIGMSRRIQKKVFNRFYQVDSRLSRRTEGCGLGLSIVRFIVDAHKGTIDIKSELNAGSTLTVSLDAI